MFIDLGGKHIELIYTGRNHSDNSLVVLLPQNKLLFAVDFIPVETVAYRALPDSYPDEWIDSLKQVEQLDFDTLVPGHGKVGAKEHVQRFRGYLEDLRVAVLEQVQKGANLEETKKPFSFPNTSSGSAMPTGSRRMSKECTGIYQSSGREIGERPFWLLSRWNNDPTGATR
jgi:glyoxylase-like metal-dependent hydrolase (beta-lactamase superfamily II)